jgi:transposase-like protein
VDALAVKCREAGRIVNMACVLATGVNADDHPEILGSTCSPPGPESGLND